MQIIPNELMTQNKPRRKTKKPKINQRKRLQRKNENHSKSVTARKAKPNQRTALKEIKLKAKSEKGGKCHQARAIV